MRGGFVCRYHGWNYDLNGALKRIAGGSEVPRDQGLRTRPGAGACQGTSGVRVRVPQATGVGRRTQSLPDILLPDQRVFDHTTFVDEANWKLLEEFAMEAITSRPCTTRASTPTATTTRTSSRPSGRTHGSRFRFGASKSNARCLRERQAIGNGTYTTQIFPNARVSILTNHYQVVILEPINPAQTRWHLYRLTLPGDSQTDEALERARRDAAFVKDSGLLEDRAAALSAQASLAGQGNTHFTFGLFEKAAVHFHRSLDQHLARMQAQS
ncbi:MAG: SRPBCC family protein [Burkholderiaceae bacterium]